MKRFHAFIRSVFGLASDSPDVASPAAMGSRRRSAHEFGVPGRRTVTSNGFKVELDLSTQVLEIQALLDRESGSSLDVKRGPIEAPLSATLGTIDSTGLVSASVLAQKAKIFDDGLCAAVEVATQEGAGRHTGKAGLLASLGGALAGADPSDAGCAQELLLGAARLGHVAITGVPRTVEVRVQSAIEAFLANEVRSKPIGFYTWSRQLGGIFQQDRMLQGEIDAGGIKAVASALRADPSARATYEGHLRFVSRLTNPFAEPDLRRFLEACDQGNVDAVEEGTRFFPPSVAHETEIIKKLFGTQPIPVSFVLVDEMIRRIRSRELDLEPRAESGWYDYQTWALEALVIPERMPEGERLELDKEYRKLLLELFKGLLTLTRETHIKQLEITLCGAAGRRKEVYIDIAPALSAEPLVTFYLRRALGYRYVRGVLEDTFGPGQLERLHRLTQVGPAPTCLAEELAGIETLFLGAHVSVSRELGLAPDTASGSDASATEAADRFAAWARNLNSDSDLSLDLRAMVPVFYDVERCKPKVWAFLGWSHRPITVSFARPPQATILDRRGRRPRDHPKIRWGGLYADLPYPVTAELYVDRILDRDEFRRLCDACGTRSEIMRRLGAAEDPA
jgi:hypothetical protein